MSFQITPGAGKTIVADTVTDGDLAVTGDVAYLKIMDGAAGSYAKAVFVNGGLPVSAKLQYNSTPPTVSSGSAGAWQGDTNMNLKVTDQGLRSAATDSMAAYPKGWRYVTLSSASKQILAGAGTVHELFVTTPSSIGTVRIADNTVTGSGYISAAWTPVTGINRLGDVDLNTGGYCDVTGTVDGYFAVRSGLLA